MPTHSPSGNDITGGFVENIGKPSHYRFHATHSLGRNDITGGFVGNSGKPSHYRFHALAMPRQE